MTRPRTSRVEQASGDGAATTDTAASASAALDRHGALRGVRSLLLVLGDQLDPEASVLRELDHEQDAILMLELREEAEHVPSHRQRTALFLSAMRHFALARLAEGHRVRYVRLDEPDNRGSFATELARLLPEIAPERLVVTTAGDHRVAAQLEQVCSELALELDWREDEHFLTTRSEFEGWASGRKTMILEHFYRWQRKRLGILLAADGKPEGGRWNFDADNRAAFDGAPDPPPPLRFKPDAVTREVIALVRDTWPDDAPGSYGSLDAFGWPVTPEQAAAALDDFVTERLPRFGTHQDAMWSGEPFLYHALLSPALNLKLIRPARVVEAVLAAYASGAAPLNAVEGFVRQVVGWREFVRGVYQHEGPGYEQRNALEQHGALPSFYWTGESGMACVDDSLERVLEHAYGHHIERLMVLGNLALIAGVSPQAIHGWFLAMYADAVAWVTAPNTIGMSQHADGGVVGTKPYAASGKYVQRMSNYCTDCRYDVRQRLGDEACPLNALYWDFLIRQREALRPNRRMAMILANVDRLDEVDRDAIRARARTLRDGWGVKSKD